MECSMEPVRPVSSPASSRIPRSIQAVVVLPREPALEEEPHMPERAHALRGAEEVVV